MAESAKTIMGSAPAAEADFLVADSSTGKIQVVMLNACPTTGTDRWVSIAHRRVAVNRYLFNQRLVPGIVAGEVRDPIHLTTFLVLEVGDSIRFQGEVGAAIDVVCSYFQGVA